MNWYHSVIYEIALKYCISDSSVDSEGYSISSKGFLPTVVDMCVLVTQSCPTLCKPMDCSPPGFLVHWVLQARTLEWVAISFSRQSSQPRDRTQVSYIADRHWIVWATREAHCEGYVISSKGFLPTVVDIMVIWIQLPFWSILIHWFLKYQCSVLPSPVLSPSIYPVSWT